MCAATRRERRSDGCGSHASQAAHSPFAILTKNIWKISPARLARSDTRRKLAGMTTAPSTLTAECTCTRCNVQCSVEIGREAIFIRTPWGHRRVGWRRYVQGTCPKCGHVERREWEEEDVEPLAQSDSRG